MENLSEDSKHASDFLLSLLVSGSITGKEPESSF
jgi:hypothetical protein